MSPEVLLQPLRLPLAMAVAHASHSRITGESLLAEARCGEHIGFGEGCPRPYVTGEDLDGALAWGESIRSAIASITDVERLRSFVGSEREMLDAHPAAWCAIETALLDVFARREGVTVEELVGIGGQRAAFEYTAVLFEVPGPMFEMLVAKHASYGFRNWKMRVSGDRDVDTARLAAIARHAPESVRIDANNRWAGRADEAVAHLSSIVQGHPVIGVEEPLAPRDSAGLSRLSVALGLPVILDESACRPTDLEAFDGLPGSFVVNVKVSKAGGLLRAMELADAAVERGWPVILGAQVGETGVLTRLAMALARHLPDGALLAQEGAYGRLLVPDEPVDPELRFGKGGVIRYEALGLGGSGLGLRRREDT